MKKIILFFIALLFTFYNVTAQKSVALHSNGMTTIFGGDTPLVEAYNASIVGDTLYVSGGNFTMPGFIDKGVIIIGAGYDSQSTAVTQKTYITNSTSISIGNNASGLYMEGMEFNYTISISSGIITDFTFLRCKFNGAFTSNGSGAPTNASIIQCELVGDAQLQGITYSLISNCIIRAHLTYSRNNIIKNNIFLYNDIYSSTPSPLSQCHNNTIWNNIFSSITTTLAHTSTDNNFQYNIFSEASQNLGTGATDLNNYKDIDLLTVYVNASQGDYHLQEIASTTYLGDDGNQVGIYGGVLPFKNGAIPINPHISQKSIQTTTDSNGFLNISFTVEAQQN